MKCVLSCVLVSLIVSKDKTKGKRAYKEEKSQKLNPRLKLEFLDTHEEYVPVKDLMDKYRVDRCTAMLGRLRLVS